MLIEPGTEIINGLCNMNECKEGKHELTNIQGELVNPHGVAIKYSMKKCEKCGAIAMQGSKADRIQIMYPNYTFVKYANKERVTKKKVTKKQIRNSIGLNQKTMLIAKGCLMMPQNNNNPIPDYVKKGEAPPSIQWNAAHPYQGGGFSPK